MRAPLIVVVVLAIAVMTVMLPAHAVAAGGAGVDGLTLLAAPALFWSWVVWYAVGVARRRHAP